ncbi:MAG: 2-aminoethylphosphonate--pyruvate transaminase [Alphaproteobacteria bacterium]|jgi:2-aminoethylphosphonate-pyruvate transaminase|nr:2-aminoethylphosphonate--pyruvate transaminase [Alphaproteobacteria bacterium]
MSGSRDPWLLTPGPLTTSIETKRAMLHDWGSRDDDFIQVNAEVRDRLVELAEGGGDFTCVPVQGSGTFAVEAMVGTLVPRGGKLLVLINGAYGMRIAKICDYMGRAYATYETPEDMPPEVAGIDAMLDADPAITHVALVHCETTSGILNPVEEIAAAVAAKDRRLLVDSMSAFGALPFSLRAVPCDAVAASSNKCFEGVPGMGFVLCRTAALEAAEGNAHSLSLDLHDQWRAMEGNGQWRFTPPTHVIYAFHQALEEHAAEGGVEGRNKRYVENCRILIDGMKALGFEPLLSDNLQAPIIVTFRMPGDPNFEFQGFYDRLKDRGYVIYPGRLTVAESFRIGCIGRLGAEEMRGAVAAVGDVLAEMDVANGSP